MSSRTNDARTKTRSSNHAMHVRHLLALVTLSATSVSAQDSLPSRVFGEHPASVSFLAVDEDERLLITAALDGSVRAWTLKTGELAWEESAWQGENAHFRFSGLVAGEKRVFAAPNMVTFFSYSLKNGSSVVGLGGPNATTTAKQEATTSLYRLARGDEGAKNRLFELLYQDLHRVASARLRAERADHTLQPTALVNEAWMRLIDRSNLDVTSKGEFMAVAAQAMRRILVDHARRKTSLRAGRDWKQVELSDSAESKGQKAELLDLVAVDEALEDLRKESERLVRIVELRFFAGLSREETAEALSLSRATVARDWRIAQARLKLMLQDEGHA